MNGQLPADRIPQELAVMVKEPVAAKWELERMISERVDDVKYQFILKGFSRALLKGGKE